MEVILLLGGLMALAWLVQSVFGFFQIKNFNQNYIEMRAKGRVAIGRRKGMLTAGTVVMLAINKKNEIIDARKMEGLTVLARVKPMKGLEDKHLLKLKQEDLNQFHRLTAAAIQDAVASYDIISKGGELKAKKTLFEKIISKFKK
ncbi:transcriptional regulator GutM [Evansella sp. LMS18]|uniref:transcriptional regulator GutM n=1 Tax=Evansella sp. LMS18 TaxID=2924033 RepID=UPI0020CFF477|nr:transcriptional regulator GutM [Evansella sp. LMS18]UTR10217.1 transcriptional regulator GutM [Evansella sp. LMS18]